MAVYSDAASEYLARTANLPTGTAHTFSGWARIRTDRGTNVVQPIASLLNASFAGWSLSWESAEQEGMVLTALSTGGATSDFAYLASRPAAGSWFYWWVRCAGTGADQLEVGWRLLGSDTWVTTTVTAVAFTPSQFHVSDLGGAGSFWSNLAHAHLRCWNRVLTSTELLAESKSATPVSSTNINFAWLLDTVANLGDTDLSANNREPTVGGTLSTESSPTLDNLTAGTATAGLANGWLVTATATDASGGTSPYTYQWQRSARGAGTWSDITGQTTLSLIDRTVTASTNYDYRLRYTDGASAQVFSNTLQIDVPAQAAVWTILGDSQTDEYRADDNRAAGDWEDFVLSWIEQLAQPDGLSGAAVNHRSLNVGTWGTRAEPRRTGFANNWARSGATMETLIDDQLAGAVAQITAGTSTHAALWSCANEWVNPNAVTGYHQYINEIYNSPDGVNTETLGITIAQVVSDVAGRITDTIDAFVDANVAGMAVVLVPDFMTGPMYQAIYTDATRRGYVSTAIADIATAVNAHVSTINTNAGVTVVSTSQADEIFDAIWATADGTYATVAGLQINYVVESNNAGPLYFAIVPDGGVGISHPGAIAQSVYANVFLLAANDLPGISITPFSDAEIRENAGVALVEDSVSIAGEFGSAFAAVVARHGEIIAGIGAGSTLSAQAAATASLLAGVGAGEGNGSALALAGSISAQVSADEALSAIAQAVAAINAGVEAGESWASLAQTAASLAAQADFGASFAEASSGAESSVLTAGTQTAASFISAAQSLASLSAGATISDAIVSIAATLGQITAGASLNATFEQLASNAGVLSASASLGEVFAIVAAASGSFSALIDASAVISARAATQAALADGVEFGAAFVGTEGILSIIPPSNRRVTARSRSRAITVTPRSTSIRVH